MSDLYRTAVTGTVAGERFANVIYLEKPSSMTAEALCSYVVSNFIGALAPRCAPACHWDNVSVTEVGHLLLDPDYFSVACDVTGSQGDDTKSDPQLALCLRLHTGLSGRKRRGRIFIPGFPDLYVQNGRVTGPLHGPIVSSLTSAFVSASLGSNPRLVVFSRKIFSGLTDIILDAYKPVTSITANLVMSTMRSRKPAA